ncbi:hypothetical protein KA977_12775, partial [Candidatus Dependentiae bacterium]|nr:hypothetical protein [Candidatus Dependentiae bacterium]
MLQDKIYEQPVKNLKFDKYICKTYFQDMEFEDLQKIICELESNKYKSCGNLKLGRAGIIEIKIKNNEFVIRQYSRGGAVSGILKNKYLSESRFIQEFYLLKILEEKKFKTVIPSFLIYYKCFPFFYSGYLATYKLSGYINFYDYIINNKTDFLKKRIDLFFKILVKISELNYMGIYHTDIQLKNIMISNDFNDIAIIDFDKGKIVKLKSKYYFAAMFYRFLRSLVKHSKTLNIV